MTAAIDRETESELEREIAALIRKRLPEASEFVDVEVDLRETDGGASGEIRASFSASENGSPAVKSDKRAPTKRKRRSWYPPGEPSPPIYPEEVDEETMRRAFDFEPIKTRGKLASEIVIEDRLAGW